MLSLGTGTYVIPEPSAAWPSFLKRILRTSPLVNPPLALLPAVAGAVSATNPAFAFNPTHFLVHGLNLGAEVRF